jgi:hypothetical protein
MIFLCIRIPGQSLGRIIFDLWAKRDTFGLREMDSMTHFWCQKVGLSHLFCVILRYIFGLSKCDWQRAKSAIVRFLAVHYFSIQTKKNAAFRCAGTIYVYLLYCKIWARSPDPRTPQWYGPPPSPWNSAFVHSSVTSSLGPFLPLYSNMSSTLYSY